MKALTAEQYACLRRIDQMQAEGLLLEKLLVGGVGETLVARGALALQVGPECECGNCKGFLPTPTGRLAMHCYEVLHTPELQP